MASPGLMVEPAEAVTFPFTVPLPFSVCPLLSVNVPPTALTSNVPPLPGAITEALLNEPAPLSASVPPLTATAPVLVLIAVRVNVPDPTLVRFRGLDAPSANTPSKVVLLPSAPTVTVPAAAVLLL